MNFPDLLSMDYEDESSLSPAPDDFVISTYKGNPLANINSTKMHDSSKISFLNKCFLCRKIYENTTFTCSNCVNAGKFCSVEHKLCSTKQREVLLRMLTKEDYEEFQDYSDEKSIHWQCADRMFMLEKFKSQRIILQLEFDKKSESFIKSRLIAEEIQFRKDRFRSIRHSIEKCREQIEQKKILNRTIQHRIDGINARILSLKKKTPNIKKYIKSSATKSQEMINECAQWDNKLLIIRQRRMKELMIHVFPIQHVLAAEAGLARRVRALRNAQESIDDEINDRQIESENSPEVVDDRYQIVDSFLPSNGKYQIENLVSIYNDESFRDIDSLQFSPSCDSYKILSALSHACQLINIIAIYLNVKLPFNLHPWSFSQDELLIEHLRADIAKLNANIITTCLSHGIPIEFTNVTHTPENLLKLLTFDQYPTRPNDFTYPVGYIDMLRKEVADVNRAFTTSYWFDDDDNDYQKQEREVLTDEYEVVPQSELIPDGLLTMREHIDSSLSASGQQQASIMSASMDFIRNTGSSIFSRLRNLKS